MDGCRARPMLAGRSCCSRAPPLELRAAVLEAVYPSIDRAVVNRLRMRIGPLASVTAPLLLLQLQPRIGVAPAELRPVDHIAKLGCPVLVIAGTRDRHTTLADTQMLFAAARDPKELWLIPDAAHVDYLQFAGDVYRSRIVAFLKSAFARAAE